MPTDKTTYFTTSYKQTVTKMTVKKAQIIGLNIIN